MKTATLSLAVLALLVAPASSLWAGDSDAEAKAWLSRMIQSAGRLNYEGVFVYVQGQHVESMRILQNAASGRQRMIALNGMPREVVVASSGVVCLLPNQRLAMGGAGYRRAPFPPTLPEELDQLEGSYDFKLLGEDRVAGYKVKIVDIRPRDQMRYGYRLWLEDDSAMVLRSALLDERQRILEQIMFTTLRLDTAVDESQLDAAAAPDRPTTEPAPEAVSRSDWVIAELPPGFREVMHTRYRRMGSKAPTEHIVLSDGLATISVFLERLAEGDKPVLEGASPIGAMNAYGRVVAGHQALVVGEAPVATVERIATALSRREGAAPP
ncbi:MAG TPA: MucB/RseB C-terminal domain-containing protein [Candidatus Competibacteraceae bacterium]|nr:MucB/RseB C-terminal domain-containing protein [Candidatus Competibacteraceae bacterium]